MIGRVVSNKMQKTASVLVESVVRHPLYKKTYKRSKRYLVEDQIGVKEGDVVELISIRPISKNKRWAISKVIGVDIEQIVGEQLKVEAAEVIEEVMPEDKDIEVKVEEDKPKPKKQRKGGGKVVTSAKKAE